MNGLSILIPTYNDECRQLVGDLLTQCEELKRVSKGFCFEIIVADDGSTDRSVLATNSTIGTLPNCRFVRRIKNCGRAQIRNFLAGEAAYDSLLFIDSDMTVVRRDFIAAYVDAWNPTHIIYGGYEVHAKDGMGYNLRYRYERSCREAHTAQRRREHPYSDFHTSNFMIPRSIFLAHPLDTNFRQYGYEDVVYGEQMRREGIIIDHIDNPIGFCTFEDNASFVSKTEEGLSTLCRFREQLEGYSRLMAVVEKLERWHMKGILRTFLRWFLSSFRNNLTGSHPNLTVFNLYKLGYLLKIMR